METDYTVRVLIVEDDPDMAVLLSRLISKSFPAVVDTVGGIRAARERLNSAEYDVVTLDYLLPDGSGLELLEEMTGTEEHPQIIMITGHGDEKTASQAFREKAADYVVKDDELSVTLIDSIERALATVSLERARRELEEERALVASALDAMEDLFFVVDAGGKLLKWNSRVNQVLGYTDEELGSVRISDYQSDEPGETIADRITRAVEEGHAPDLEVYLVTRDGRPIPFEFSGSPLRDEGGNAVGICAVGRDITERKRAQEEIVRLSRRVMKEQEDARSKVAADLHDEVGQSLGALKLELDMLLKEEGERLDARGRERAVVITEILEGSIDTVRAMQGELRPSLLADFGLGKALGQYVSDFSEKAGIEATLLSDELPGDLPSDVQLNLFRIAQESLANAQKHSGAKNVEVSLSLDDGRIALLVRDDGCGFDASAVPEAGGEEAHFGLLGMRMRAEMVGGELAVRSKRDEGTTVIARVSLEGSDGD